MEGDALIGLGERAVLPESVFSSYLIFSKLLLKKSSE